MNKLGKIVGVNLLILVLYSALLSSKLLQLLWFIALHLIIVLILSFADLTANNKEAAQAYLLTAGIVLLIGLSICFGTQ